MSATPMCTVTCDDDVCHIQEIANGRKRSERLSNVQEMFIRPHVNPAGGVRLCKPRMQDDVIVASTATSRW